MGTSLELQPDAHKKRDWTMQTVARFFRSEQGTTSVEYAVMLASILLVLIVGVSLFGSAQNGSWFRIDSELQAHGIN